MREHSDEHKNVHKEVGDLPTEIATSMEVAETPALPVEVNGEGRYRLVKPLGEGGMGTVYKAYDPLLKRFIALKFIRWQDPKLTARLLQEGRAQARINHPNVCRVYEVGRIDKHYYIAMQYLDGVTLTEAAQEMTLEHKIKVIAEVADALHAAHREGLIHRDVKPQNIIVEKGADGAWVPYVMDFGLAREVTGSGMTAVGTVLGTPSYMAPEQAVQAFGEATQLDRRADIYSLGVTLYELLSGHLPFGVGNGLEILSRVINIEPQPLRKLDDRIPEDLESIVMKCLEKEPQLRYESARALAEDLRFFLDGEPIKARRTNLPRLLIRRARKHKAILTVSTAALLAVLALGISFLAERRDAAERVRLAQLFGQEVQKIEAVARYASLLPLHDIRAERALIRARMQKIEAQLGSVGAAGQGPGHYALGRGFLALRQYEQAREHLERAWQSGYRTPECAYALGQTLGLLYRAGLEEVQLLDNRELMEARKREIEALYREPALKYLKASDGSDIESPVYVEGLIAFYEKRYEEALAKAAAANQQLPWLYEAKQLIGDIHIAMGKGWNDTGNYAAAAQAYRLAGEAYASAIATAHSDESILAGECERRLQAIDTEIARGAITHADFAAAHAACDSALQANPQSGAVLNKRSHLYWKQAEFEKDNGEDAGPSLDKAIDMAAQAERINSLDYIAPRNLGLAYWRKGEYEKRKGLDPRPAFERAIASYQKAVQLKPGYTLALNSLALVYRALGDYELELGLDPRPALDLALASNEKALAISPDCLSCYNNIGNIYWTLGKYEIERGGDPEPVLMRAIESFKKAVRSNPNYAPAYNNIGLVYRTLGKYQLDNGIDARAVFQRAIESCRKAIESNGKFALAYKNLGISHYSIGLWLLDHHVDADSELAQARAALTQANTINPNDYYVELSRVELAAARNALAQGRSPAAYFQQALNILKAGMKKQKYNAEIYQTLAELHLRRAAWVAPSRRARELNEGLAQAEQALKINPRLHEAHAIKGLLLQEKGRAAQIKN